MKFSSSELKLFSKVRVASLKEASEIKKHFFEKKIRVLGVSGSARSVNDMAKENSNSEWLLQKCLDEAKMLGAETKLDSLRDYEIKPCKACYSSVNTQCHYKCSCYPEGEFGDDMHKLYDDCAWADVIVFATPVNNFKISSMMSLFIDRLISMDGSLNPANPDNTKDLEINLKHAGFVEQNANGDFGSGYLKRFTGKVAGIIVTGHEEGASMVISQLFMTLNHYGMVFPPFSNMYAMASVCNSTGKDKPLLLNECYEAEARILAKNVVTCAKVLKSNKNYWWANSEKAD